MMDEIEIKIELDGDVQSQCVGCLSIGRNLNIIGDLADIYKMITSDMLYTYGVGVQPVKICWECQSVLRKVHRFRCQVKRANELLQLKQSYLYGSLSCLTTEVLNETHHHTIYINESNIEMTSKQDNIKNDDNDNSFNDKDNSFNDNDVSFNDKDDSFNYKDDSYNDKDKPINEVKNERAVATRGNTNKWAKKRAQQNKKPKFKILANEDVDFDEAFVKVDIDETGREEYNNINKFKCDECVIEFSEEELFIEHNSNHDARIPCNFTCDICKSNFQNKRHLLTHLRKHYYKFKCTLCDYTCRVMSQTSRHFKTHHGKVFQCLKCRLKFKCRREFFTHYKQWHEKFVCDYCGISFKMRYCIKDHIRKQHSPHECKPCNKRFARYNGLWLHNKTHHTETVAAYCVECDKRYADVYRYRWHLANSTKHTPRMKVRVPCPGCDKIFSKNIYMKDHYNLVHLKNYKYRCEQCDKNFIRNADLVKHKRRIHEGILPPKNKICYVCGKGFSSNKILCNHIRTHTGERPFSCSRCGASFAQTTALAAHTRAIHTHTDT